MPIRGARWNAGLSGGCGASAGCGFPPATIAHHWDGIIASSFKTHLGPNAFKLFGETFAPMLQGGAVLLAFWLILFWMYRRKLFLRI